MMDAELALVATVAMSFVPALLFLGLIRGLRRMQTTQMMEVISDTAGVEAREVTLRDAYRGALGLQDECTGRPVLETGRSNRRPRRNRNETSDSRRRA